MSKYDGLGYTVDRDPIEVYLDPMEYVYWKGKGNKKAFIFNNSMAMAPFALIWLLFDGGMIASILGMSILGDGEMPSQLLLIIVPFFAVHLMPVWIWIAMMFKGAKRWKNTSYAITDKQILIRNASAGRAIEKYEYDKIVSVTLKRGFLDKMLKTSDLIFRLVSGTSVSILDIKDEEAQKVFPQVKQRIDETPCVRELHTETTAGQSEGHECKDYPSDYNPYE